MFSPFYLYLSICPKKSNIKFRLTSSTFFPQLNNHHQLKPWRVIPPVLLLTQNNRHWQQTPILLQLPLSIKILQIVCSNFSKFLLKSHCFQSSARIDTSTSIDRLATIWDSPSLPLYLFFSLAHLQQECIKSSRQEALHKKTVNAVYRYKVSQNSKIRSAKLRNTLNRSYLFWTLFTLKSS